MQQPTTPASSQPSSDYRAGEAFTQRAHSGIDRLSGTAHDTVERVASVAGSAADRLGAKSGEWMQAKNEWMDTTRGYVREHPFAALGVALAAGYLISRLTSR
jgi:ElaB/YqjD/DUF883 family membrane-anchored ribosome-binding protein